jgi:hypothetical protein
MSSSSEVEADAACEWIYVNGWKSCALYGYIHDAEEVTIDVLKKASFR